MNIKSHHSTTKREVLTQRRKKSENVNDGYTEACRQLVPRHSDPRHLDPVVGCDSAMFGEMSLRLESVSQGPVDLLLWFVEELFPQPRTFLGIGSFVHTRKHTTVSNSNKKTLFDNIFVGQWDYRQQ